MFTAQELHALPIAPGARILARDAEWLVRKVDRDKRGNFAIAAIGLSELVRDREVVFLTDLDPNIQILDPRDTEFVADPSPQYSDSLLYLESRLRQMPPTLDGLESQLRIGHRAAMDVLPFQLEPALFALDQPRQRILIADTVGLGKTLEAGILLSELIARGRGKRILVVTVKSMMAQFQKEMWNRFTIPLVRLDSTGLARVRAHLPTNHNPFHHYDRSIVSIDTLKQDREYRIYLEQAHWDIIVIDEAHHVAERGTHSQRNKLAKLLANRSDTLIMLSATPHDGKPKSFASLMNMLDPTAIADPENYTKDDIKGLFIRRFKQDVGDQLAKAFRPRKLAYARAQATPAEEMAFDTLVGLAESLPRGKGGGMFFGSTLAKALFSSPAACLATVRNRLKRLESDPKTHAKEITGLRALEADLEAITPETFSKFQQLVTLIRDQLRWKGNDPEDRLVLFTERIETLKFLAEHLPPALGLKPNQVLTLEGSMPDTDQQACVEAFGQRQHPVRLLIASDVASEGINLHFLSHRMIHFDVPWSLMVFQQRNGRIDRYGQEHDPELYYLVTDSRNARIRGDVRILELLTQKDQQAHENIGDPSALMGVFDVAQEEALTASAMEQGLTPEAFDTSLDAFDPLALLFGDDDSNDVTPSDYSRPENRVSPLLSLFASERAYARAGLKALQSRGLDLSPKDTEDGLAFVMPPDLRDRFDQCPREVNPFPAPLVLTDDRDAMQAAIKEARASESAWPSVQYLWPQHPAVGWLNDRLSTIFERPRNDRQSAPRHQAPVIRLPHGLASDEAIVLVSGVLPNRKGHPLIQEWLGISLQPGTAPQVLRLSEVLARTKLGAQPIPNNDGPLSKEDAERFKRLLPAALGAAEAFFAAERTSYEARVADKLQSQQADLERLQGRKVEQLKLGLEKHAADRREDLLAGGLRKIDKLFSEHRTWVEDTLRTGDEASLQVMALLLAR